MKMIKYGLIAIALLASVGIVFAGGSGDDIVYFAVDTAPVTWLQVTGNDDVTFKVTADSTAVTVTVGTVAQTIADGSFEDVDAVEVALKAITNDAGDKVLDVFRAAAVGTESTDDEVLLTTVTIRAGDAGAPFYWDTSDSQHYRVYIPPSGGGSKRGRLNVTQAFGSAKGTGDVTAKAYLIDSSTATEKYMYEAVSPVYIVGATSANTTTSEQYVADDITPAVLELVLDIFVGKDQGFLFSADRATTGTTGGMGVRTEAN